MIPADYEPVEDRLRDYWSEHKKNGRVRTAMVRDDAVIVFKATVYDTGVPIATGYAHQRVLSEPPAGKGGKPNPFAPEWTSPYEVAETSAIGRALANAGYAAKGKRPSREEISKASAGGSDTEVPTGKAGSGRGPSADTDAAPPAGSASAAGQAPGASSPDEGSHTRTTPGACLHTETTSEVVNSKTGERALQCDTCKSIVQVLDAATA